MFDALYDETGDVAPEPEGTPETEAGPPEAEAVVPASVQTITDEDVEGADLQGLADALAAAAEPEPEPEPVPEPVHEPVPQATEASPASAFGSLAVSTPGEPEPPLDTPSDEPRPVHVSSDLLPTHKPAKPATSLQLPIHGNLGKIVLIVVCLLAGFLGYRMFSGGSGGDTASSSSSNSPGGEIGAPGNAVEALDDARLAAAEVELRQVAVQAETYFAEHGSYNLPAQQWASIVGKPVVAAGSAPVEGTIGVVADDDAVCFETLTAGGVTAALGLGAQQGIAFATSAGGESICTADAAVIGGWQPTLAAS